MKTRCLSMFWICVVLMSAPIHAQTKPVPDPHAVAWWLSYAQQQVKATSDSKCRDEVLGHLCRAQTGAGEFDGANASAAAISDIHNRIRCHIYAAKGADKQGNRPSYVKAMEQARAAALTQTDSAAQISVNGDMIQAYLDCNDVEGAKAYAGALNDPQEKDRAFRTIAAHMGQQGDLQAAHDLIRQYVSSHAIDNAWLEMAETCIRNKRVSLAEQIVPRLVRSDFKDRAGEKLGIAWAEKGDLDKARSVAAGIGDSILKSSVLAAIARAQIAAGDIKSGLKTAEEVTYRDHKIAIFTGIAEKQADAGDIDAAVATIQGMAALIDKTPMPADRSKFGTFDDSWKSGMVEVLYLRTAVASARTRDMKRYKEFIEKALDGVRQIQNIPPWKGTLFVQIVDTQLECKDIQGAKATTKEIKDELNSSFALLNIVSAQLKKEDIDGARATYKDISDTMNKSSACALIASTLVKKGQPDQAKILLLCLGTSAWEALAYRDTARTFVETGRAESLAAWLDQIPTPQARVYACIGAVDGIMKR